ncbi:MAG: ATP-binding protein [Bacteroidia bacterium]
MTIRNKLSFQFTIITSGILILFSISIYLLLEKYRKEEFIKRLKNHAEIATLKFLATNYNEHINYIARNDSVTIFKENVIFLDSKKNILFESYPHHRIFIEPHWLELNNEKEAYYNNEDYEIIIYPYYINKKLYYILASGIDLYGHSKLKKLKILLLVGSLIFILISFIISRIYASQALKPISKIIKNVDNINEQNLHARLQKDYTKNNEDELNMLIDTFNRMLDRIEDAFIMKRNFVSNASHELRTPLTAITGQLEVTLLKERNVEEYKNSISSVLDDIKKLNQICNGLLELTYANNQGDNLSIIKIRIDELLWEIRNDIQKIHPEYQIEIDYQNLPDDENVMFTKGNLHLIRTALINVIDNACKYSPDKLAKVVLDFSSDKIKIQVRDNGIGISEEEQKKIFTPFYRSNNAKSFQGSGLGLALSKRIIEKYNGKIWLTSQLNKGTTFFIELPVAA